MTTQTLMTTLTRGLLRLCPHCSKGRLFERFLKVVDRCDGCGEAFHHHQADDFPAYIVIFILGHVLVPAALTVETTFQPKTWVHLALWLPSALVLALGLLQPVKGAVVAMQWRMGLHGFARVADR